MSNPRTERRARRAQGFSLIEVVIAMGILAFGLLTLAAMQLYSLTQGAAGRHTGDAAATARTYLEQAHRVPWTVLTAAAGGGWQAPGWANAPATVTNDVATPTGGTSVEETYTIQWQVTNVAGNACLRDVELRVSWNEENLSTPKQLDLATRRYNWGGASC